MDQSIQNNDQFQEGLEVTIIYIIDQSANHCFD